MDKNLRFTLAFGFIAIAGLGVAMLTLVPPLLLSDPSDFAKITIWVVAAVFIVIGIGGAVASLLWKRGGSRPLFRWKARIVEAKPIDPVDSAMGVGEQGGYRVFVEGRFDVGDTLRIDAITANVMGETVSADLLGDWLLSDSVTRTFTLTIPRAVAFGSHTLTLLAKALGQSVAADHELQLEMG